MIPTRNIIISCVAIFLALAGCAQQGGSWFSPSPKSPVVVNPAYETNLNGNLNGWEPVEFAATPFSSIMQHSFCEEGGDFDPDISRDGKLLVFSSLRHAPNPDLYIKQINGSTATRLSSDPASEIQPSFSPSGDKVAYASNRSGNWDIWVIGVDGGNPVRLTTSMSNDIHPSWSADGKWIVYCSYGTRSMQWELWIVSTENPSLKKWIGYGMFPEWSPNPAINKIAYQLSRYRGSQWFSIWTIDLVDGEARFPTEIVTNLNHACINPTWSPDGSQLAYSSVSSDQYDKKAEKMPGSSGEDVWIVDINGRSNRRITMDDASNYSPTWSPDGRLYFCSDRKYIDNIWSVKPYDTDFKSAEPVQLSQHPQAGIQAN